MKITEHWLNTKGACPEGVQWFLNQKKTDSLDVLKALKKADKFQWANWLICRVLDKPNQIRYAIFAAGYVLDIFEKEYPKEDRPRKALEAAQAWLDNPNDKTSAISADASTDVARVFKGVLSDIDVARACKGALSAANAAAFAAYIVSSRNPTYSAFHTINSAFYAINSANAINHSYTDAPRKGGEIKILNYGIKLLKKVKEDMA